MRSCVSLPVSDMLEELAVVHTANELRVAQEPVLAAVFLSAPEETGRRGDGDLQVGDAVDQCMDQRALPGARGAGHDEDGLTG